MYTSTRAIVAITVVALAATACSSSGEGEANKAGGSGTPIVLKVGTDDFPPRPAAAQIEEFGRRVAELSDDFIRIEPVWRAGDGEDWDQVVARKVMDGTLDMGNVPTRAWDVEGVTSLQALNAPFLITSDALLDEVVSSDLAGEMMAGLEDVGVVGLALLPESLRRPFGFPGPLLGPGDYAGGTIRAPLSAATELMFSALGAATTGADPDFDTQIGIEAQFGLDVDGQATGNVTFYPKVEVLVVNADVFTGLTDDQRSILQQAAAETRDWAIENRTGDLEAAAEFCDEGGTIVLASDADLAALREAVEPVYAKLTEDADTAEFIAEIENLKASITTEPLVVPDGCTGPAPAHDAAIAEGTDDPSVLNGTYRLEWTADDLFEALLAPPTPLQPPPPDVEQQIRTDAEQNAGVVRLTFEDGRFDQVWESGQSPGDNCPGTYAVTENRVTMVASTDAAQWDCGHDSRGELLVDAAWERKDGELILSDFVPPDEPHISWWFAVFLGSKPLVEID